jgi:S1-C subfamily serine protease
MKNASVSKSLTVTLRRQDKELSFQVTPGTIPLDSALDLAQDLLGVRVSESNQSVRGRTRSRFSGGVVVTAVASNSYLSRIGVSPGDVIHAIDDMSVSNMEEFKKAVINYRFKKTVVVLIERNGRLYNVTVELS